MELVDADLGDHARCRAPALVRFGSLLSLEVSGIFVIHPRQLLLGFYLRLQLLDLGLAVRLSLLRLFPRRLLVYALVRIRNPGAIWLGGVPRRCLLPCDLLLGGRRLSSGLLPGRHYALPLQLLDLARQVGNLLPDLLRVILEFGSSGIADARSNSACPAALIGSLGCLLPHLRGSLIIVLRLRLCGLDLALQLLDLGLAVGFGFLRSLLHRLLPRTNCAV